MYSVVLLDKYEFTFNDLTFRFLCVVMKLLNCVESIGQSFILNLYKGHLAGIVFLISKLHCLKTHELFNK